MYLAIEELMKEFCFSSVSEIEMCELNLIVLIYFINGRLVQKAHSSYFSIHRLNNLVCYCRRQFLRLKF
jgi:hypothetical protein